MDGETEAVVVSPLAGPFYILLSLRDTNTQQRGEERLPTAKLFSQLSRQVASCLCMQIKHYTFHGTHACTQVDACCEHHVLLLDSRHHSVQVIEVMCAFMVHVMV